MAATPSTMLALGTRAPAFALPDLDGRTVTLEEFADAPALLVMFICNHCPYVQHVERELAAVAGDYQPRGLAAVAISANDVAAYPADGPAGMREQQARAAFAFPYLYDETQDVARAYHAACTPDLFLFDRERRLVYRGQLDGSRPGNAVPVTGADLRQALDAVLRGEAVTAAQTPSIGCNIKWKPGGAPEYGR